MGTTHRFGFVRPLLAVVRDQQLSFLAAAVAYYAFVSLIPLVLLSIALASALAGPALAEQVTELFREFLTPEAIRLLESAIESSAGRSGATVFGIGVLLWSGLRLFRGLDVAFANVYDRDEPVSLLMQIRDGLIVLGGIGIALTGAALLGAIVPFSESLVGPVGGTIFLLVVLTAAFFPLYYVLPECSMTVREALPGAVLAAGGWTLLGLGFGIYADNAGTFQLYGLLGGVLLVLTWFYLGGLLILLGAALNATLADRFRDRQLQQGSLRETTRAMSDAEDPAVDDTEDPPAEDADEATDEKRTDGVSTVEPESVDYEDFAHLRRKLETLEDDVEDRTVHREDLESDLEQYVRTRIRRSHARGWGPYLVLLYGTAMTVGAFYFLAGGWAILAMLVIWLSTLGLYVLMLIVGAGFSALNVAGRGLDVLRKLR